MASKGQSGSLLWSDKPRENCSDVLPYAHVFLSEIEVYQKVLVAICGSLVFATIIIFLDELRCLRKCLKSEEIVHKTIWLLGLYPVFVCTSILAIVVPRSSLLDELLASGYLSVGIYKFLSLMILYYGGEASFLETVEKTIIPLRSPPLACCCCCCPSIIANKKNFNRIRMSVLQCAFVQPLVLFLSAVLWTEGIFVTGSSQTPVTSVISVFNAISTLSAMYGLILIYRASGEHLQHLNIKPKFMCLQLVLLFSNLQKMLFNFLSVYDVFPCIGTLGGQITGKALNHGLLIVEMFLLSLLARFFYLKTMCVNVYSLEVNAQNSDDTCPSKSIPRLEAPQKCDFSEGGISE